VERAPARLSVAFAPGVEAALVEQALAVERECCPFFALDWDPAARVLHAGVGDPGHAPALEALAEAFGAG
jgi:hypothetical protein